jgi:hypothetical protein
VRLINKLSLRLHSARRLVTMRLLVLGGRHTLPLNIRYSIEERTLNLSLSAHSSTRMSSSILETPLTDDVVEEQLYTASDTPIWLHVLTWVIKLNAVLKLYLLDKCSKYVQCSLVILAASLGASVLLKCTTPATD